MSLGQKNHKYVMTREYIPIYVNIWNKGSRAYLIIIIIFYIIIYIIIIEFNLILQIWLQK